MPEHVPDQAHEQVLRVAGCLFRERGYTAVTMRDITDALNIRQASLYSHTIEGKEQLFVEVTQQQLIHHRRELDHIIEEAEPTIATQLRAIASWLLSQPPLDFTRFFRSELTALSETHRYQLADLAHWAWLTPIEQVISASYERGEIRLVDRRMMAISFIAVIESVHDMHRYISIPNDPTTNYPVQEPGRRSARRC